MTGVPAEPLLCGTLYNDDILYHRLYRSKYNNEIFLCENVNSFTTPFALRAYYRYSCLKLHFRWWTLPSNVRWKKCTRKYNFHEGCTGRTERKCVSISFRCQEPLFSVKSEVTGVRFFSRRDNRGNYSSYRRIIFRIMIATAAQLPGIIRKILTNLSVTFHTINHLMLQLVYNQS